MKTPRTVSDVRSLYGLLSFYRKFVYNFSKRNKPITKFFVKEDGHVLWDEAAERAKCEIIESITSGALLLARFGEPFFVSTDFSYEGLGAVLS